jgi:hypothetical protein
VHWSGTEHYWVWSAVGLLELHRPERWGYVQFSKETGGDVSFRPDPTMAARELLHELYYAQRAYRKKNGKWARSTRELRLTAPADRTLWRTLTIERTSDLYQICVDASPRARQRLCIRHDSLVWTQGEASRPPAR